MATLDDYRNNTGEFAEQPADVQDAAAQEQYEDIEQADDTEFVDAPEDTEIDYEEPQETDTDDYEDEQPELSPKEKTAFEKRMERERRKLEEELSKQFEQKYSKHNSVIQKLGGDPEKIEQYLEDQRIQQEVNAQAQQMAYNQGWDDEQMQWYINNQMDQRRNQQQQEQLQQEVARLKLEGQINELRDNPEFAGIHTLKNEIADLVTKSNGNLTVSQAYWALGGEQRAKQMKRESEQRAAVQRRTRVVAKDSPTAASTEQVIPANVLAQAQALGMSEKEIRDLVSFDAKNINEYRQKKKK